MNGCQEYGRRICMSIQRPMWRDFRWLLQNSRFIWRHINKGLIWKLTVYSKEFLQQCRMIFLKKRFFLSGFFLRFERKIKGQSIINIFSPEGFGSRPSWDRYLCRGAGFSNSFIAYFAAAFVYGEDVRMQFWSRVKPERYLGIFPLNSDIFPIRESGIAKISPNIARNALASCIWRNHGFSIWDQCYDTCVKRHLIPN